MVIKSNSQTPSNERRKTQKTEVTVEEDVISKSKIEGWSLDYSLILWIALSAFAVAHYLRFGQTSSVIEYYAIMGALSGIAVLFLRPDGYRFNRTKGSIIREKNLTLQKGDFRKDLLRKWGSVILSALVIGVFMGLFHSQDGHDLFELEEIILTATAEQLFFALMIPAIIVKLFPVSLRFNKVPLPSYIFGVILSGVVFWIMHSHKYGGADLAITAINGTLMILLGFWLPGGSIAVHFTINAIATLA